MSEIALPALRDELDAEGLRADKRFGQHFLLDLNLTRRIARLCGPLKDATALEVGPGPGGLTRALLEAGAHVVAVERDPRFRPILERLALACPGQLEIVGADALETDDADLLRRFGPLRPVIASNLPYNIGTALLVKWIFGPARPDILVLMFQKEVAERIAAGAGEPAYGRLSVISQAVFRARVALHAPARAFTPPPKVASAVVTLEPLTTRPEARILAALERVTQAAFGQRRKMLRSSLKSLGGEALCRTVDIDPTQRAEDLPVSAYLALAAQVSASSRT